MMNILEYLREHSEIEYAKFISKLTPTLPKEYFLGVRVPHIKQLVKLLTNGEKETFLNSLPHNYYEENLLHGFIIQQIKDFDCAMDYLEKFLPYISSWAVSDTITPKCFKKKPDIVLNKIKTWIKSKEVYTVRIAIIFLMNFFLEDNFKPEILQIPMITNLDDYYVKMAVAWFYQTALTKRYNEAIKIIEDKMLPKWIHNKAIQKSIESNRISDDKKIYLKSLKIS